MGGWDEERVGPRRCGITTLCVRMGGEEERTGGMRNGLILGGAEGPLRVCVEEKRTGGRPPRAGMGMEPICSQLTVQDIL